MPLRAPASAAGRAASTSLMTTCAASASARPAPVPRAPAPRLAAPSHCRHPGRRAVAILLRAVGGDDASTTSTTAAESAPPSADDSLKSTLGALDALLGVEPETPKEEAKVRWCGLGLEEAAA